MQLKLFNKSKILGQSQAENQKPYQKRSNYVKARVEENIDSLNCKILKIKF